jgi:hypothetical protein
MLAILGGSQGMFDDSPLIQQLLAEHVTAARRKDILIALTARFGPLTEELREALQVIENKSKLDELVRSAASCPDLATFRARLQA